MIGYLMSGRHSWRGRLAVVASLALIGVFATPAPLAHAVTNLYVDQNNPSCTNTGSGTATRPYCTISKAASVATAGQTVLVSSGTYNEQVIPANSGTSSAPVTYQPAPGATVTVGGQIHAFTVTKAWIVITGFTVSGTSNYGIYLKGGASNVTLSGNRVTASGIPANGSIAQGIYVRDTTDSHLIGNVTDHNSDTGIYLTTGASNVEVRGNWSFSNARQYTRAATGIDVRNPGNSVIDNVVHDNEDSGIQLYNGASGTLVADNLSYNNGDHGIDVLNSTDTIVVGNTVYGSVTSGINFEGTSGTSASSRATLANNISVDNGLNSKTTKGNIRVDANSQPGTTLDYDLVYLSSAGTMATWGSKTYSTLAAFSNASGQETHGLQAQPGWVSVAQANFKLAAGSSAIDSATSLVAGEQTTDLDGAPRVDDPATPNIGVGPRTYDDRGAYEYQPDQPPVAALVVSPTSGTAPVLVTADASGSTDTDATPIESYSFDWGDGSTTGQQADPTASHTYAAGGTFRITVTVTDTAGKSSTASRTVQVTALDNPPVAALSISPQSGTAPLNVTADASASTDTDATPIATYTFDFGDGTGTVGPQITPAAQHTYGTAGGYTATVTVTDTAGLSSTATASVTVGVPNVDEVHYTWLDGTTVAFDWRGGPNTIAYGSTKNYGNSVTASTPSPLPYSSAGPFWEARLTGLQPGTTYHYSIGGSADQTFDTSPTGSFRFDVEADVGDSVTYPAMGTTQSQIGADAPDLVLVAGDLTYGEAHGQRAVDQHFNDVMAWSETAAYQPAWGNHEWETTDDDLRNYKGRFAIPNAAGSPGAPSLGCCGEDWGWFDAGGVRFIAYPEPYSDATWTDWKSKADPIMAAAQSDPSIRYIVTFGHRPAYSTGAHDGSATLASILNGLGDKYSKYVLNLNGHSHDYERFQPIHGVTHVTTGGGGAALETPWTSTDPRTAFRAMHLEHLRIDVTPTAMTLQSICGPATSKDDTACTAGSVLDQVVIPAPATADDPPVARLTLTPNSGAAPLAVTADASGSTDTDSTPIASYAFDFGDGTSTGTQTSPTATHTYRSAGTYTVAVTVTDTAGRPSTSGATVTVTAPVDSPPAATLSVTPTSGAPPLAVTADASGSTDTDSTPIASYAFDFGDGTNTGQQAAATANHTYTSAGTYTVVVTVTDTAGLTSTASDKVFVAVSDSPPAASLTVTPTSGAAPLTVNADGSGSTDTDSTPIATYKFNFGDGTVVGPQSAPTASHQYTTAGSYTVTLTVTDTAGNAGTTTASVTVSSANQPPVAALIVTPNSGPAPLPVTADASGSSDPEGSPIASYRFNFGDGVVVGPQAGATATHTYSAAGSYTVTVTVTDAAGLTGSTSRTVTVQTPAGANLIGNPGFETDTSGWNNNGRTGISLTRVSGGHSGSWAAQLSNTTTSTQADCTLNDSPNWIKTTQAGTYTAGLWVRADTGGAVLKLRLREYNGSTFVNSATAQITLSTAWQQIKVVYPPQVVGSTLDYTAYTTNAAAGTCFTADDASVTVG
jgi:parallel beta-helix repeat protein